MWRLKGYLEKKEAGLTPYTIYKINLKWTEDLNVRRGIIKFLEENRREKFRDIGFGNDLLVVIQKAQTAKEKTGLYQT